MHKQHGFGLVGVIVVILALGVVGFAGWYVWNENRDERPEQTETSQISESEKVETEPNEQASELAESENDSESSIIIGPLFVNDVQISELIYPEDLVKLPDYTPSSFITYMEEKLSTNNPSAQCVTVYSVSKISPFNINGGGSSARITNEGLVYDIENGCGGGAPIIWVLTPRGTWEQASRNGTPCVWEGGLVYEEFGPECVTTENIVVPNPNGSLFDI